MSSQSSRSNLSGTSISARYQPVKVPAFSPKSVAFVTGAGSGIGLATAKILVADGIKQIALIDLTERALASAAESIKAVDASAKVLKIRTDCTQEEQVDAAVAECVKEFGRLDVCLNAAGVTAPPNVIADQPTENMERVMDVNLMGVWYCERAEIRQMMKQELSDISTGLKLKKRGSIVNVGSLTSHVGIPFSTPYVMSKHAVLGLTKADSTDYAAQGIRVNVVCPGWILTSMTEPIREIVEGAQLIARCPMKRWGMPEEVAHTVSFLLSDKASFISGAAIDVDGGYCAS